MKRNHFFIPFIIHHSAIIIFPMSILSSILAALTPWIQAFFQALLPFLKQQATTPVERTVAEKDPVIQQEVSDAIDQYDRDHLAPSD